MISINRESALSPCPLQSGDDRAFTLLELLVVISIIGTLAALLLPSLSRAKAAARSAQCMSQMRQLGLAVRFYADNHEEEFPRSQHSAFAHRQQPWGRALALQLSSSDQAWTNLLQGIYHCPSERRKTPWSYGLNVYFELGPEDDYRGSPATWRKAANIPRPVETVLFGESTSSADHFMAHFWQSSRDAAEIDARRHGTKSIYAFVDGHAESLVLEKTFRPSDHFDLWNPLR